MTLFLSMLPLYLFGNLHCFGMCGPLVMMIGQHRYRMLYFIGRIASFTLAGYLAGSLGFVLQLLLNSYHIAALVSFFFGGVLIILGLTTFFQLKAPRIPWFDKRMAKFNQRLSYLILKDQPLPSFLFGFFTLLLPCGQSLIVFSACALVGDPLIGGANGFIFALLTSPSLFVAMQLSTFFKEYRNLSTKIIGITAITVGSIAVLRGVAEMGIIPHFVLWEYGHVILW